ncbi:MAG: hypothetical protein R8K20_01975 [Gallionellaceae bacterium]
MKHIKAMTPNTTGHYLFILTATLFSLSAHANEADQDLIPTPSSWKVTISPQITASSFTGSPSRDSALSYGLATDFQYLERAGFAFSYDATELKLKPATTIQQTSAYLSGRMMFTPDSLTGFLSVSADVLSANNNDSSNETNGVVVGASKISFLNYAKTYYLDLGYARSGYGDSTIGNGSLSVQQLTPTLGLGFGSNWLQLRGYNIQISNPARAQGNSSTSAVESIWTHYYSGEGLIPSQIRLGALLGKRIYAVDSSTIYNLADVQKGGLSLAAQWSIGTDSSLTLQSGQDQYEADYTDPTLLTTSTINYSATYLYLNFSHSW